MPSAKDLDAHSPMAVWGAELRYYRELRAWTLEQLAAQIVPYGSIHLGFQGSFVIADVDGRQVAYVETAIRGMTLGSPEDVAAATDAWESIRTAALSQQESLQLIKKVAEQWT